MKKIFTKTEVEEGINLGLMAKSHKTNVSIVGFDSSDAEVTMMFGYSNEKFYILVCGKNSEFDGYEWDFDPKDMRENINKYAKDFSELIVDKYE